jgi:SAM-dependent methyltransferase
MNKKKFIQKEWYEHKIPVARNEVIQTGTLTHIQRLKDLFPLQKATLSLNCGCGRGGQKDIFGPSIAIDISFANVRSLVKAGGQGVVADMEFLPFKDETFDIVYGFGILHHLSSIKKGVLESTRVLKNGGYLGFGGENNGLCPLNYLASFLYQNWRIERGFYRIRKGNLKKIFRELGIREFKISRRGMTIYGMGRILYQLTSLGERFLSRFKILRTFSGYCYVTGRKVHGTQCGGIDSIV